MYRRVLAFDFDGTLAENGSVPKDLQRALVKLHTLGCALFLVTGRRFEGIPLGVLSNVFDGIVWENGAVICRTATNEVYLPFGYISPRLVESLEEARVPLEHGLAIVSTWTHHRETTWKVLSTWGGDATVVGNKGALMILPAGAAKGSGLEKLLELCGYSPRNLASFGDAENDLSLLQTGEIGIAVGSAVPQLKAVADLVTEKPGPAGVLEAIETYWLSKNPPNIPSKHARWITLGNDPDDNPVYLPGTLVASANLGIIGDSNTGKSWVAGLIAEGMHVAGYQILLIDPEGDFRGLRVLPRMTAIGGDQEAIPSPSLVTKLLEESSVSVVLDLSIYPASERDTYIADLLRALRPLKERKFRPHWIVIEEAQHFLGSDGDEATANGLLPLLAHGGCALVSYRPDWLPRSVLAKLNQHIVTSMAEIESQQVVRETFNIPPDIPLSNIPPQHILLNGEQLVRLRQSARRVQHIRHLYKYLDMPLPRHKRFYFRDKEGYLGLEAASLFEFKEIIATLPLSSLMYHHQQGDFAAWVKSSLGDATLSVQIAKLSRKKWRDDSLREALLRRVTARYAEINAMP
ncbi:MAG: HAD hydrolase family protein [Anaerolineae bacterium]|nr:HAD hydrolase family protein [Anaerolineae bacterium]